MNWRISFTDGKVVQVFIHETREGYEEALSGAGSKELQGSYACFKASPVRHDSRKVGEIHLVEGNYGVGVVAHEALHAVFHWLDYIPGSEFMEKVDDEALCRELGRLCSEFWTIYYAKTKKGSIFPLSAGS